MAGNATTSRINGRDGKTILSFIDSQTAEFERLYREAYPIVYNYAYRAVLNQSAAEDITSEAFLKAARSFSRFDSTRAKFSTWVVAIARNCVADHFRTSHANAPLEELPENTYSTEDDSLERIQERETASRLLEALTPEERELVFLKYYEDKRNKDIAEELGLNPSTVATRLQRALLKMRTYAEGD